MVTLVHSLATSTHIHDQAKRLAANFEQHFAMAPQVYRAPGRVNLIGEHTDYNDGFVLPMAIEASAWVAIAPRQDDTVQIISQNVNEQVEVRLHQFAPRPRHWSNYVIGVVALLARHGIPARGADILIYSEVPMGAGLSSSAALEVAATTALLGVNNAQLAAEEAALLCQRAEHEFVGTRCGIMDQFISCFGKEGQALLLDCRSLAREFVPLPEDIAVVICNSMVKHSLATGEYNIRRAECEEAVHALSKVLPSVRALRDLSSTELEQHKSLLADHIYRRARHVITENERTLAFAEALQQKDIGRMGELMYSSHQSLRRDYDVSCSELDTLVEIAQHARGVIGARMTGGGFGGCTVNLVHPGSIAVFSETLTARYQKETGIIPEIYITSAASGASRVL